MKAIYNKSRVMKRAWLFLNKIAIEERTNETWSDCLKQSWNVEKNGTKEVDFNHIYSKHYKQILNFIRIKVNGKTHIAEELTQDVFIKANKHLENYDVNISKVSTWLFTIAKRIVIDYYRVNTAKDNRMVHVDGFTDEKGVQTFDFIGDTYVENIDTKETYMAIDRAMNKLNDKEKDIAEMYFLYEKKYEEISELLSIPMGSVKGTINRIRTKLQKHLQSTYSAL